MKNKKRTTMTFPFFFLCFTRMITIVVRDAIRRQYALACATQSHSFHPNNFKMKQGEAICPVLEEESTPNLLSRSVSVDLLTSES